MITFLNKISKTLEQNWKIKIIFFWILCLFPKNLLFYIQHNISKRSTKPIKLIDSDWDFILSKIKSNDKDININFIEFGGGRNLAQNIYLALNCDNLCQTVVDLNHMINPRLCYIAYAEICEIMDKEVKIKPEDFNKLLSFLRIKYESPVDISQYKSDVKYDFCVSKDTLEHIPKDIIPNILININNLLSDRGILISCVDYSDHYQHSSKYLSKINFLKFSKFTWFFLNPPNHYQNRIRHIDLIKMLEESNYENIEENLIRYEKIDISVSNNYKKYNEKDILTLRSQIISLKKYA